jgi:membrane-associated phospholipid phosphatase
MFPHPRSVDTGPRPSSGTPVRPPVVSAAAPRHLGRLLAAALGYLLALGLTGLVFVWTGGGQQVDGELVPRLYGPDGYPRSIALARPARSLLSLVEDPAVLAVLLLSVLLVGALGRRLLAALAGIAAALCSVAGTAIVKLAVPRPDLGIDGSTTHNSFPSGHVAAATGLVFAYLFVLPAWARWLAAIPATAVVTAVASATMIAGWHRFSDALGAILLTSMLSCLAAAALAPGCGAGRAGRGGGRAARMRRGGGPARRPGAAHRRPAGRRVRRPVDGVDGGRPAPGGPAPAPARDPARCAARAGPRPVPVRRPRSAFPVCYTPVTRRGPDRQPSDRR